MSAASPLAGYRLAAVRRSSNRPAVGTGPGGTRHVVYTATVSVASSGSASWEVAVGSPPPVASSRLA